VRPAIAEQCSRCIIPAHRVAAPRPVDINSEGVDAARCREARPNQGSFQLRAGVRLRGQQRRGVVVFLRLDAHGRLSHRQFNQALVGAGPTSHQLFHSSLADKIPTPKPRMPNGIFNPLVSTMHANSGHFYRAYYEPGLSRLSCAPKPLFALRQLGTAITVSPCSKERSTRSNSKQQPSRPKDFCGGSHACHALDGEVALKSSARAPPHAARRA
jgi:hypothetical protein